MAYTRGGVGTGRNEPRRYQRRSDCDAIEAGNQWLVQIAVVVLLAVEGSRGKRSGPRDGNTCAGMGHVELSLIEVRSMSEINHAELQAEAPLSIQVWHPRKYCTRTIRQPRNILKSSFRVPQLLPSRLSCKND
jgi:hypothetical protein